MRSPSRYSFRHANTWLAFPPCARATRATDAPGSSVLLVFHRERDGTFLWGDYLSRVGNADRRRTFEVLLRTYLPALRRLARAYAREAAEQEDLLQEIAMGLWTALPHFRGDASERTWLYRVAHNTAISF